MKHRLLNLLLCMTFIGSLQAAAPTAVRFFSVSLPTAKAQAAENGKLIFVDFTASWCMPCQWMDETTFNDPVLADYIGDNYIALKIDIEDFDGIAYKQQYDITLLPTMLIFNSKGELLEKVEESLASSTLLEKLQLHKNDAANVMAGSASSYSPPVQSPPVYDAPSYENDVVSPAPTYQPETPIETPTYPAPTNYEAPPVVVEPEIVVETPTVPTYNETPAEPYVAPISSGEGLFEFNVRRVPSVGYSIQIGAFSQYGNVLTEVDKLKGMFDQSILIHIANLNGQTVYKILVGTFDSRDMAVNFQYQMRNAGVEGIIKDLKVLR